MEHFYTQQMNQALLAALLIAPKFTIRSVGLGFLEFDDFILESLINLTFFSFFLIFFMNLALYSKFNTATSIFAQNNRVLNKLFMVFESEEELGAFDDGLVFITLFFALFS